jgi:signal peptidase I
MEEFSWPLFSLVVVGLISSVVLVGKSPKYGPSQWRDWGYFMGIVSVFGVLALFLSLQSAFLAMTLLSGLAFFLYKKKIYADRGTRLGELVFQLSDLFYMLLVLFVIRSFLIEPYRIPSSSMRPGLIAGDFILVNRYAYGLRVPILNEVMVPVGKVKRGDVMVFHPPYMPSIAYIKRVVALPGDTIEYRNKELIVNGHPTHKTFESDTSYIEPNLERKEVQTFKEEGVADHPFKIHETLNMPAVDLMQVTSFKFKENCQYDRFDGSSFKCKVPAEHYFVMGDNRDNSLDSRYWGFVPDNMVLGRAVRIWLNFSDMSRIGKRIE